MSEFRGKISSLIEALESRGYRNATWTSPPEWVFDFGFEPDTMSEKEVTDGEDPLPSKQGEAPVAEMSPKLKRPFPCPLMLYAFV